MGKLTRNERIVIGAGVLLGLAFLAGGSKVSPGGSIKVPEQVSENWTPFTPPPDVPGGYPVMAPDQHMNGYVYTPHRYPSATGNDVSILIHKGLSMAALPSEDESLWISAPPSEGEL